LALHSNHKYKVISFFLIFHLLTPETLPFAYLKFPVIFKPTQTWKDEEIVMVLALLKVTQVGGVVIR